MFYFLVMGFYFLGELTVYTNIFGTGFGYVLFHCDFAPDDLTSTCSTRYIHGIILFCLVVGVIAALDYKEQAVFQMIMMSLQLVVVGVVLIYSLWKFAQPGEIHPVFIDFPHIGQAFSLIIFASNYHTVFPSILAAAQKDKRMQKSAIVAVTLTVIFLYGSIGVLSAVSVPNIPSNVSHLLRWEFFGYEQEELPVVLGMVKQLMVLLPVLAICSIAPIFAQSLSGVVVSLFYGADHTQVRKNHPYLYRLNRSIWMIPAGFFASLTHHLVPSTQTTLAGATGLMIVILIHIYVPLSYNQAMNSLPYKSTYDLPFSGTTLLNSIIAGFFICFLAVTVYTQVA